MNIVGL